MPKGPDQIAAKATDSPPEPLGEAALSAELTELSLEALMDLPVSGHAHSDPEDPGLRDHRLQATGALLDDLTTLPLGQLMNLRVSGKARSDSNEPKVEGLLRNEDLPEDLAKLGLAELMTLRVGGGRVSQPGAYASFPILHQPCDTTSGHHGPWRTFIF